MSASDEAAAARMPEEEDEIEDAAVDDGACADYYVTDEFALQAGLDAAAFMNELHAGDYM